MNREGVLELLDREVTPELYQQIRKEWKVHSIAEDNRDIPGLLSTLTEDCIYEIVPAGPRWDGHEGAARFYQGLLSAFPDIKFNLTHIVIGPQGVYQEAAATATHRGNWLDYPATGQRVKFSVMIFFPWDVKRGKFKGERIYVASEGTLREARAPQ